MITVLQREMKARLMEIGKEELDWECMWYMRENNYF